MSDAKKQHNISPVITFADDVEHSRSQPAVTPQPVAEAPKEVPPVVALKTKIPPAPRVVLETVREERKDALSFLERETHVEHTPPTDTRPSEPLPDVTTSEDEPRPFVNEHEESLKNEIQALSARSKKTSLLSDVETVYDTSHDDLPSGTIIQDKKRSRKGFFTAIFNSLHTWFSRQSVKPVTAEVSPVEKPASRNEVIQKAVTETAQAPKNDFAALLAAHKLREQESTLKQAKTETLTNRVEETDSPEDTSGWTHVIQNEPLPQVVEPTLPEPPVVETADTEPYIWETPFRPESIPAQVPYTEQSGEEIYFSDESLDSVSETAPLPEAVVSTVPVSEEIAEPVSAPVEPLVEVAVPVPPSTMPIAQIEAPRKITDTKQITLIPKIRRFEIKNGIEVAKNANTNTLTLTILIIIGALALGVFVSFKLLGSTIEPNYTITIAQPPALIAVTKQIPVMLTQDRIELLGAVLDTITNETDPVQIYPTALGQSGREEPAGAQIILEVFNPKLNGSLVRSITDFTFGGDGNKQPFIILKGVEFDTTFAGMLAWEEFMSADLAPLFGAPVTNTLDPNARTESSIKSLFFTDAIIANRSARILYDEFGVERIVYVFVNQNTVLISTGSGSIEKLVPLVR